MIFASTSSICNCEDRLLDAKDGHLILKIWGPGRRGQIVRLESEKCTVGSGRRCTLRLDARGVRPVHCLIVRGAAATVVRRWGPDTRLNGRAFGDAELTAGDRLSIGPIELEVLRTGGPPHGQSDDTEQPGSSRSEGLETGGKKPDARQQAFEQEHNEWNVQKAKTESELAQRSELLKTRLTELDGREAELETRLAELGAQEAELKNQRQTLEQQRDRRNTERSETEDRLNARAGELDDQADKLDARQQALDEKYRQWEAEREVAQRKLEQQSKKLDSQAAELKTEREAAEDDLKKHSEEISAREADIEAQREATEADLTNRQQELDAQQARLESERESLEEQRCQWEAQRNRSQSARPQPPKQPEFQPPIEEAPVDAREILGRLETVPLLPDEEPESDSSEERQLSGEQTAGASQPEPKSNQEESEEESIEAYMARLMERMRTGSGGVNEQAPTLASVTAPKDSPPQPDKAPPTVSQPAEPREPTAPAAHTPSTSREPVKRSRRVVAPEKHADLSAMRELANVSAETAIYRHARRKLRHTLQGKLLVATTALVAGGLLMAVWRFTGANALTYYAALANFAVAVFWGTHYVFLAGRMILKRSGRRR